MSDREEFRPFQERDHLLRQTFAWRLERPEDLAVLVRVLEIAEEWAQETGQFGPEDRHDATAAAIEAAERDALLLGEFLREQSRERFGSALTEEQARLCESAELWANQARELGEAILSSFEARA